MGESTCLMQQPFSYVSGFPNDAKEGNPIHGLGQSVSFGRFMTESLAWEKWSTFSHNKYVEEAERYARPGSVAQKKAFFEAHYKKIAAQKAAAAALLEQANSGDKSPKIESAEPEVNSVVSSEETKPVTWEEKHEEKILVERDVNVESPNQIGDSTKKNDLRETELENLKDVSDSAQMEKPLLKRSLSKKRPEFSTTKLSGGRAPKQPSSPAKPAVSSSQLKKETLATPKKKSVVDLPDKKRATPKSIYMTPAREINRFASSIIRRIDGSKVGSNSKPSKDCSTPLKTPTTASVSAAAKQHPVTTPWSENKRAETPVDPSTPGSKTVRAKWNFLPTDCSKFLSACRIKSQSPNLSTPFRLRTEERAAKRKEKLEEKFNASQAEKAQQQITLKEKAETELKKLRQSLCFKARPLPDFYKERPTPKPQVKKVPLTQPMSPKLGRTPTLSAIHRRPSNTLQKPSPRGIASHNALEKIMRNSPYSLTTRTMHIPRPNIHHD